MNRVRRNWPSISVITVTALAALVFLTAGRAGSESQPAEIAIAAAPTVELVQPVESPLPLSVVTEPQPQAEPPPATVNDVSLLNARRQFALGMIETGNDDREIGRAGEISRYQIMPSVWKHYSASRNFTDPDTSLAVAQQHWTWLYNYFKSKANREPTDFDMYVLWNTRAGYYSSKNFNPKLLHPVIRDRAQRFVNLVERGQS